VAASGLARWGGLAAIAGGVLWALTPLREPILGGRFPGHPVFRPYNLVLLIIGVLLMVGLLALYAQYRGRYGRLGTAGVVVIFVGYALIFIGSIPAVLLSADGLRGLIMAGQDLGFLGALIAGVGTIFLGIALWRVRAASRLAALLLIIALPVGFVGVILVSAVGFEDIAGLPLTVLYGGGWIILGSQLWSGTSTQDQQPTRVM
jgi:hypothetical protein